jgi:hypothetical protein
MEPPRRCPEPRLASGGGPSATPSGNHRVNWWSDWVIESGHGSSPAQVGRGKRRFSRASRYYPPAWPLHRTVRGQRRVFFDLHGSAGRLLGPQEAILIDSNADLILPLRNRPRRTGRRGAGRSTIGSGTRARRKRALLSHPRRAIQSLRAGCARPMAASVIPELAAMFGLSEPHGFQRPVPAHMRAAFNVPAAATIGPESPIGQDPARVRGARRTRRPARLRNVRPHARDRDGR